MRRFIRWVSTFSLSMMLFWWWVAAFTMGGCAFWMTNNAYAEEETGQHRAYVSVMQDKGTKTGFARFTYEQANSDIPTGYELLGIHIRDEEKTIELPFGIYCATNAIEYDIDGRKKHVILSYQFFELSPMVREVFLDFRYKGGE